MAPYGMSGADEESTLQPNTLLPVGMNAGLSGAGLGLPTAPSIPTVRPQANANPWADVARMLQGFLAGTQGRQNPMIQLEQRQQELDQRRQMHLTELAMQERARRLQEMQLELAVKKEERAISTAADEAARKADDSKRAMLSDLAKMPSVDARVYAARGYADLLRKGGLEPPPGFEDSFRAAPVDKKDLEAAGAMLVAGMPPQQVSLNQGISLPVVTALDKAIKAGDPGISRLITGKTPDELRLDSMKVAEAEKDVILKDMKINDPGVSQAARDAAIATFGRRFMDLKPEQQKQAVNLGYQRELEKARATAGIQPVPLETTFQISDWERIGTNISGALKILESGKADKFIGPLLSGAAAANRAAVKNLPEAWVGKVPDELIGLSMAEASLQNVRMRAVSGGAVTDSELTRNLGELPSMERDKPEVYKYKMRQWRGAVDVIERRLRAFSGIDGRTNLSNEMKAQLKAQAVRENPLPSFTETGVPEDLAAQGWRRR